MTTLLPPRWPYDDSPFHAASRQVQAQLGVEARADRHGRGTIRTYMPEQHRSFFAALPFVLLGGVDGGGQAWASVLVGQPGFLSSPTPTTLRVAAGTLPGDPLRDALAPGAEIGILGIDPATRRRNRLNGRVAESGDGYFEVAVSQSFGNCPQYIQRREYRLLAEGIGAKAHALDRLDEAACRIIQSADTFFIASACLGAAPEGRRHQGVDVSHRGGKPGFVKVADEGALLFPDFAGNAHYRTLGNLLVDRRAGLLFIDFPTRDLLYLAVDAAIIWEGDLVRAFPGAQLLVRCRVRKAIRVEASLPLAFSAPEYSPVLAPTGTWNAVEERG